MTGPLDVLGALKVRCRFRSPGYVELEAIDERGETVLLLVGSPAEIRAAREAGEPLDEFIRLPHRTAAEVLKLVTP